MAISEKVEAYRWAVLANERAPLKRQEMMQQREEAARAALVAAIEEWGEASENPNQNQLLLIGLLSGAGPQKREQYLEFYRELIRARSKP